MKTKPKKPKLSTRLRGIIADVRELEEQANPKLHKKLLEAQTAITDALHDRQCALDELENRPVRYTKRLNREHEMVVEELKRRAESAQSETQHMRKLVNWVVWMALDLDPQEISNMSQGKIHEAMLEAFPREPGGMGKRVAAKGKAKP